MCSLRGYRVIGLTSRCKTIVKGDVTAAQKAQFGCEELIILENEPNKSYASYTSIDIAKRVMEITGGIGCKLVIDGVGLSTYEISLNCLAQRGLFVSYGNASGPVPPFPVLRLLPQSAYMTRPKLNDYVSTSDELLARAEEVRPSMYQPRATTLWANEIRNPVVVSPRPLLSHQWPPSMVVNLG